MPRAASLRLASLGHSRIMLKRWFHRAVFPRRWLTFLIMGIAFFAFGVGTFNIFMLFSANFRVISRFGWQALMDGAARQLVELVVTGYLSMAAYVIFKACEHRLTHDLSDPEPVDNAPNSAVKAEHT
jgi:hypothetical protein